MQIYKEKMLQQRNESMIKYLMDEFDQNRVVVEYFDETIMFKDSNEIDSKIK